MARKKKKKKSWFTTILFTVITIVTGGGIGGHFDPDMPVVGRVVRMLRGEREVRPVDGTATGNRLLSSGSASGDHTAASGQTAGAYQTRLTSTGRPSDKLLIASFNVQVFGESKLAKSWVLNILAQVMRQFDIVAIQEIRTKRDDFLPRFLSAVNADGSRYQYLIGPRLGRTVSTEQYAFVYDSTRVTFEQSSVGTISDPRDLLHREPFVARFRPLVTPPERAFSFWLVNVHTDPDEVKQEVDVLADAFQIMRSTPSGEDDVILLGDLNASSQQLGRLGQIPGIRCVVTNAMTNTRQTKSYDNLVFHGTATSEFTGRGGIVDLRRAFGLSLEQALEVSDHLPIWAEFSVWEHATGPAAITASRDPNARRTR